jgi:peptide/nickel transport system permease protein
MRYFLSKFIYYLLILLGIILFSFVLFHIVPSDPARTILGPYAGEEQVREFRAKLGLDQPYYLQLWHYLERVTVLDFGSSFVDQRKVGPEILARLQITGGLLLLTLLITGLYVAGSLFVFYFPTLRTATDVLDFSMSSLPIFFSGVVVALVSFYFSPISHFSGTLQTFNDWVYLFPPAFVLSFYPMAILSGVLKKELELVLCSLYITTERAWGFSEPTILFRYALRNALLPFLSSLSNILPMLLTGAFIIEIIFSIPGVGTVMLKSIMEQDFPMLEGIIIANGIYFVAMNIAFECLYTVVDPRLLRASNT